MNGYKDNVRLPYKGNYYSQQYHLAFTIIIAQHQH